MQNLGWPAMKAFLNFRVLFTLAIVVLCFSPSLVAKSKDDVIVMKNGDRLTGEIKGLQQGALSFKASYMSASVSLDWNDVARVESKDVYIVSLANGQRFTGQIESTDTVFHVLEGAQPIAVKQPEVVSIAPEETSFWKQLNGSIDYGFSFTSGNSQTTSSLSATTSYYNQKNFIQVDTSSQFDGQNNAPDTNRYTFTGQYARELNERWFLASVFDLLKSDQQQLNLRTTYGGGVGRWLFRTPRTYIRGFAGLVYTHESYFPQPGIQPIRSNVESLLGIQFATFRFKTLDVSSKTFVFPSLTDPGRLRLGTTSDIKIELIKDFYWDFRVYENFDSRPPVNAPRNDLGITTSLGWKF
jgi:putative salt-induced outer membrane protein YdiY